MHTHTQFQLQCCVCTLVGVVNDNGSLTIKDAFANQVITTDGVTTEDEPIVLLEETHHDLTIQMRQKCTPNEIVMGWATTDLSFEQLQTLSDWAKMEPRASKFVSQKRLPSPLLLTVQPPTAENDFAFQCYVKGPIPECFFKPLPIRLATETIAAACAGIDDEDTLLARLDQAIALCDNALGSGDDDIVKFSAIGRKLHRTAMVPMPKNAADVLQQNTNIHDFIQKLAQAQIEIAEKIHAVFA